ncbi:Zinc finger c2h2-type protein [Lasiodiplodia theobromae]|uniref:Zinc finger c2h2-type protein n=1 Tax=Lasiodiplodia theobromae TaxID=45133 RepID=UPI0015C3EF46|nr:Zinc finger c2h2-type protein [Lasiodiplodia theobromae]KAF4542349.1 Zinc finger c2h2-type protein [Lasiodiplodia theobromae]
MVKPQFRVQGPIIQFLNSSLTLFILYPATTRPSYATTPACVGPPGRCVLIIVCGFDGYDWDELEEHFYETDCYSYVCYGCHAWFRTSDAYYEHAAAVVACSKCAKHCHTQAKLKQHMAAEHQEATVECWGCSRMLVRVADMISHLESGSCPSGCSLEDISYKLMAKSTSLRQFVHPRYHQDFRNGVDIAKVHSQAIPFVCEGCYVGFRLFSGLCQHLESGGTSCDRRISDVSLNPLQREFESKFQKQMSLETSSS